MAGAVAALGQDDIEKEFFWSVRANALKISAEELEKRFREKYLIEKIPWIKEGFWIKTEENLSKSLEHALGYFFIQNPSSMVPPLVLDPKPNEIILDLCASPGAKTTQLAAMMQNTGAIIANDITHKRLKALRGNLQRCGVSNTVVIKMYAENFWETGLKFNKILLDVPCTGTGTMNPRILKMTKEEGIRILSKLQKRILTSAAKNLGDDGTIIYSTCSLETEENEEIIDFGINELNLRTEKFEIEKLPVKSPILENKGKRYDEAVSNAIRVPYSEKTEGFFICKLRL